MSELFTFLTRYIRKPLGLLAVALLMAGLPAHPAMAGAAAVDIDICAPGYQTYDYTTKIVDCIQGVVLDATTDLLQVMSDYMVGISVAVMTLAVIVFGFRIVSGERNLKGRAIGLIFRIGLVGMYGYMLGGMVPVVFDTLDYLNTLVTGGFSPWAQMDYFLGRLFGFGPSLALFQGLLGLIGAALFSSTTGVFLFLAGFAAVGNLLLFIFRVVFVYLTAVTLIAFLLVVSPLTITTALFFATERYFVKWLHLVIYAILVPVMMFAFLWLFLFIFDQLITDIFTILGGNDFKAYWRINKPMFSWLLPGDPNFNEQLQTTTGGLAPGTPAVQSNITPQFRRGLNTGIFNMPAIDFGPNNVGITQQLTFALITLWVFASLMKSLLHKIPEVCNGIAQISLYAITMQPTSMEQKARDIGGSIQDKLVTAAGGRGKL